VAIGGILGAGYKTEPLKCQGREEEFEDGPDVGEGFCDRVRGGYL
jgi:hypothetical protein